MSLKGHTDLTPHGGLLAGSEGVCMAQNVHAVLGT